MMENALALPISVMFLVWN